MSYHNNNSSNSSHISLDNPSVSGHKSEKVNSFSHEFYQIEPALVLDIILDKNHPYFKNKNYKLIPDQWPVNADGKSPSSNDNDYTWIGRTLVRLLYSQEDVEKENLLWATPLESNISEYPVLNEIVGVVFYLGQCYYTRKINTFNTPNANANFNTELIYGGFTSGSLSPIYGNRELITDPTKVQPYIAYVGPKSKLNYLGNDGYNGALGRYYYYNPKIRSLKRREGDLIFESRFGQSIRFGAYDDDRNNDKGYINGIFGGYTDYKGNGVINPFSKTETGGGNPMMLIRNRQRNVNATNIDEKNVGGYMLEDINLDGTSIHITSGVTLSSFKNPCLKKMWGVGEEQPNFLPNGSTNFTYPKLLGDQIIVNSDRVIISAKKNEMFHYSKKRMSFVTDDEFTIDSQNQIIITTNNKTVLNAPAIYLGEYNQTAEPVLLGQTTVNWLYELCNQIIAHTHWYKHNHPDAQGGTTGQPNPFQTQEMTQALRLQALQSNLQACLSRRVFVTGGGYAPGQNGGYLTK